MTKYYVYGKNAVLEELEPVRKICAHELGFVVKTIVPALELPTAIVTLAARGILMHVCAP
jgi:hypothetical protein